MRVVMKWIAIFCSFIAMACSGSPVETCSSSSVGGGSSNGCATGGAASTGGSSSGAGNVIALAAGDLANCALLKNKTIKCWGFNKYGGLGNGVSTESSSPTPVLVSGITDAVSVASIGWSACAIVSDKTVKCWGQNNYGQLGSSGSNASVPIAVPNVSNAMQLALGWFHTCALINDGTVKCWGMCSNKQCGDGTSSSSAPPTTVTGLSGVRSIAAYDYHTCALMNDGTVKCWGQTNLGTTATTVNQSPTTIVDASQSPIAGITKIDCGRYTDYASGTGNMYSWGNGNTGTLGDGASTSRLYAGPVSGITNPVSISGGYGAACASLQAGTIMCWGDNSDGKCGSDPDSAGYSIMSPTLVNGISNVAQVSVGESTTCALTNDGNVYCWGSNYNGALGDGTTTDSYKPVHVINL